MKKQIIAVDFHCKYQKVAWLDPPTGEIREADVRHDSTQAVRKFYAQFPAGSMVGMEVRGNVFYVLYQSGPFRGVSSDLVL